MNEEVQFSIDAAKEKMGNTVSHLESEVSKIRAGKASPDLLADIMVDYYGTPTPLSQVANVNVPDSKTIAVQPWEKTMIVPIEKAILASNIGLTPINNGDMIRISLPPLTEERRKDLVKQVKNHGEHTKVSVRNARKDANDEIKKLQKDGLSEDLAKDAEAEIQKITDEFVKKTDSVVAAKEKDILTI
ncbi:ribosome recycling factor [Bacteroidales bacterium]|nr:ribosome recycling factor [Bacteroidales bacterium]